MTQGESQQRLPTPSSEMLVDLGVEPGNSVVWGRKERQRGITPPQSAPSKGVIFSQRK